MAELVGLAIAMAELKAQGVRGIIVSYAGCGDSGAIEHIGFFSDDKLPKTDDDNPDPTQISAWEHEDDIEIENEDVVKKQVEEMAYPILNTFDDWWNNDGGEGVFIIDTKDGKWYAQNGTHYQRTDYTEHSGQLEA